MKTKICWFVFCAVVVITIVAPPALFAQGPTSIYFPVGIGSSDVIPHQIIRANNDRLYLFTSAPYTTTLFAYRSASVGLPNSSTDFDSPIQTSDTANPISVDAVYDGNNIIHVLVNSFDGQLKDYPFDLGANVFRGALTLATDSGTVSGDYMGTSGVTGMIDSNGALQIAYWSNANHILHGTFSYDNAANTLTPVTTWVQVDTAGNANHPALAVSPLDNSVTVAWVSQADNPPQIRARTRAQGGAWGNVESVSTAPVWTSTNTGINIDQGPSILIDARGTKHLTYIENWDQTGYYGRIHYAYLSTSGASWTDQALATYSHDPALAIDSAGDLFIIGHGHPNDPTCLSMDDICTQQKNVDGTWGAPQIFATPPGTLSFDSSPSVKWAVVGFDRPETIEFLFYSTPYDHPTLYYACLVPGTSLLTPTTTAIATSTPSSTAIPTFSVTATPTASPTTMSTPSATVTASASSTTTPSHTATSIRTAAPAILV